MKLPNPTIVVSEPCCSISSAHLETEDCSYKIAWSINPYMQISSASSSKAKMQHSNFLSLLRQCGANVLPLPFIHGAFDSVFIKDSIILAEGTKGIRALITQAKYAQRKIESNWRRIHLDQLGINIEGHSNSHLEGGDVVVYNGKVFMGYGFRTELDAMHELTLFFNKQIIPLELTHPHFFHLDMALSILNDGTAFAYKRAFTNASWDTLCNNVKSLIPVSHEEATSFGLNWLEINDSVIMGSYLPRLKDILANKGKQIYQAELDQFQLAGGSAACLTTKIYSSENNSQGARKAKKLHGRSLLPEEKFITSVLKIGAYLKSQQYQFITVTPETHGRILNRNIDFQNLSDKEIMRQFFGWNRPVPECYLPSHILKYLHEAGLLSNTGDGIKSQVRFATLHGKLYVHSSFPTLDKSSIFFGPDSYRFVNFLRHLNLNAQKVLDIGCGTGVGALSLESDRKLLCDINPTALIYAEANAKLNECENVELYHTDILDGAPSDADLLISNPPFIMDTLNRQYCNGGNFYGVEIALNIIKQAMEYLREGSSLVMYTGSCIINGEDIFLKRCKKNISGIKYHFSYEEIDSDIFSEELGSTPYKNVERIAAVGLVLTKRII
ncbi:arginine deiminase family protein [Legionella lytica]|uniref:Arginine deiminase family protein n=1 Tax=Legionella lytica TaxID=96232 RepID=A0ABW8DB57_9GAMM